MDKFVWFLVGTIAGWFLIWLIIMFGAAALGTLAAVFTVGFPIFALIGIAFVIWWVFFR